jgi:hypothetical protein
MQGVEEKIDAKGVPGKVLPITFLNNTTERGAHKANTPVHAESGRLTGVQGVESKFESSGLTVNSDTQNGV